MKQLIVSLKTSTTILNDFRNALKKSNYELSKICNKDVSNLNKIIHFFEEIGVIKIKKSKISGREVNTPIVEYESVQFLLAA